MRELRELRELGGEQSVAQDLALALDRALFAEHVGMAPDEWQRRLLNSNAARVLLLASRQAGKSTTTAVIAAHEAIYRPGSLSLCVAPTQRQSSELFRKVLDVYRTAGKPVDSEAESRLSLELTNGSRVVALPGKEGSIRSFSGVTLLLLDEAARIPDELLAAVRPMLAVSAGRMIALTSAWGRRGWFFTSWIGDGPYERYKVTAYDCPRIPAAFLAEEKRALGPLLFQSEYECEFTDPEGSLFRQEDVQAALREHAGWDLSKYLRPAAATPNPSASRFISG